MFSIELLQAINDWQRGGDENQKLRRGNRIKELAKSIDNKFKRVDLCCFRQIALDKSSLWKFGDQLQLRETISAWTFDTGVAKEFKGGVPPAGYQGVIFDIVPKSEQVILNLHALYSDKEFYETFSKEQAKITGFAEGIGRYADSQSEVILEIDKLSLEAVYALGGFSSDLKKIAEMYYGYQPSDVEIQEIDKLLKAANRKLGPHWIMNGVKDRVVNKMLEIVEIMRPYHNKNTSNQ